jgi:hypothetical protein
MLYAHDDNFKGTIIINLPDSDINGFSGNNIIINSNILDCWSLANEFKRMFNDKLQGMDKSKIEHIFMDASCRSGYCNRPIITFEYSFEDTMFIDGNNFEPVPLKQIFISPRVSNCNKSSSMNKYCGMRNERTGCLDCINPFIQTIINTAKSMSR